MHKDPGQFPTLRCFVLIFSSMLEFWLCVFSLISVPEYYCSGLSLCFTESVKCFRFSMGQEKHFQAGAPQPCTSESV